MLNTLRKGAASWVAKIFIGLLVLSFAVWGIADIFGGFGRSTVATVGDIKISADEYQRAFQNEIRNLSARMQRPLSTEEARVLGLDARVLNQLITNASLDRHASDLNLGISDGAILDLIKNERAFQDSTGAFSRTTFEQILRANGITEKQFIADRRQDSVRRQMVEAVINDIEASKALLNAVERFNSEKRTLRYLVLPTSAIGKIEPPDDGKLKEYYDSHHHIFTAPEYRKLRLLILRPETLRQGIKISEDDVKRAYDAAKDHYINPERRHILQIAFKNLSDAEKAYQALASGMSFVEVAKAHGFKETEIDLGLLTSDALPDEKVRQAAFSLKKDEFSKPVEGRLSTVIVKVTKIEPSKVKKFEDVKSEITDRLTLEKARNDALDLHDTIEDARASGKTLKEISEEHNLGFMEINAVDNRGKAPGGKQIEGVPAVNVVVRSAFASDVGVENDPVDAGNGNFVWFNVAEVTASKLKPFDTEKAEVAENWKKAEVRSRMAKKSAEVLKELRGGKSLEAAAKSFGAEVKTSKPLTRTGSSKALTAAALGQAFALARDGFGSARAASGEERIIFQMTKIDLPEALTDKQTKKLKQQLQPQLASDLFTQYVTELQRMYSVNVNTSTYNVLTGREQGPVNSSRRGLY